MSTPRHKSSHLFRLAALSGVLAALSGVAILSTLALARPADAIANGTSVPEGQYGFATKLSFTNIPNPDGTFRSSNCSAALIAPQWIITAGHCFHDINRNPVSGPVPYPTTATIGRTDEADTTGHVVNVVSVLQSPSNDVAVAKLDTAIYDVAPLQITTSQPKKGGILRIIGWGALSDVNPTPATHLQTGQVKVTDITKTTLGVVGYSPAPNTSACLYDSGAPYFAEPAGLPPLLVSVESFGPNCPHDQVETTARVDNIVNWIENAID
jgi:secreted trypsin-like serine protease